MTPDKLFDVEHALIMYADSYVQLPAWAIYEEKHRKTYADVLKRCHIYMIGSLPKVDLIAARQDGKKLIVTLTTLGKSHEIDIPLKAGQTLKQEGEIWYIEDVAGGRFEPSTMAMMLLLHRKIELAFDIQYVGQAFGKDGERNAVDRLLKHEKLQEIAVKGVGADRVLNLLLIEVMPANRILTAFTPNAKQQDTDGKRIAAGLDKLFGTTERERVALYEAAMIRYFQPKLNKEFKDSFPSTNLKVLEDCYVKDFTAVVAEFSIDEIPYHLSSDVVAAKHYHMAYFDLHKDADRKAFFSEK
jgi:hypothetical protein